MFLLTFNVHAFGLLRCLWKTSSEDMFLLTFNVHALWPSSLEDSLLCFCWLDLIIYLMDVQNMFIPSGLLRWKIVSCFCWVDLIIYLMDVQNTFMLRGLLPWKIVSCVFCWVDLIIYLMHVQNYQLFLYSITSPEHSFWTCIPILFTFCSNMSHACKQVGMTFMSWACSFSSISNGFLTSIPVHHGLPSWFLGGQNLRAKNFFWSNLGGPNFQGKCGL